MQPRRVNNNNSNNNGNKTANSNGGSSKRRGRGTKSPWTLTGKTAVMALYELAEKRKGGSVEFSDGVSVGAEIAGACRASEASEMFEHPQGGPGTLRTSRRGHHLMKR